MGAANVFVAHQGGVSFGPEKALRVRKHNTTISRRYPHAHEETERFRIADPLKAAKKALREALRVHKVSRAMPGLLSQLKHLPTQSPIEWIEKIRIAGKQNAAGHYVIADPIDNAALGRAWLLFARRWQRAGLPPLILLTATPWERELTRTGAVLRLPRISNLAIADILEMSACREALTMAAHPQAALAQLIECDLARWPIVRLDPSLLTQRPEV